jgi:hypothetical protein
MIGGFHGLTHYQDAFADGLQRQSCGGDAADQLTDDNLLQATLENNLSETGFIVAAAEGYELLVHARWK